jgi:hypothetical protein
MQYTKKSNTPPAGTEKSPDTIVHVMGQMPDKGNAQEGKPADTGPQGAEMFPETDTWKGKPVTGDYQTIPEDKEAVEQNLRVAGEEVRSRFGLDTRGVDISVPNEPRKPGEQASKPSGK